MTHLKIAIADDAPAEGYSEMSEAEAVALAQLCKRITFSDLRSCSVDNDEAYVMRDAVAKLQAALRSAGYAPR
ncbi:gp43 [Burkholderia phage KS14]|uniref:Gp43 n=2 Tax=Kisquattuordecimvirus TaxID=2732982 RepID=E5FFJ6_9CAUD|nr:gp43 [Burkholderia phage KS14]ADP02388.1 gp43 [Burkholderia phage KS14]